MPTDGLRAHIEQGDDSQTVMLTDELSTAEAEASGRWIKTDDPVELRQ